MHSGNWLDSSPQKINAVKIEFTFTVHTRILTNQNKEKNRKSSVQNSTKVDFLDFRSNGRLLDIFLDQITMEFRKNFLDIFSHFNATYITQIHRCLI